MSAVEVAVVGAGPAGLATAACLGARGIACRLLDRRGLPGGAYRDVYPKIVLASPRALDALPGLALDGGDYVTAGEYAGYLERYAAHHRLEVERAVVAEVSRSGDRFAIALAGGERLSAGAVVVATGMWDFPSLPAVPGAVGLPGVIHARDWRGPAGASRIVIVGGAHSAIEIAEEAARAGCAVTLAARRVHVAREKLFGLDVHHWIGPLEHLPPWLAGRYCARRPTLPGTDRGFSSLRAAGKIAVAPPPERIEPGRVVLAGGRTVLADRVVLATGYRFDAPFLPPEVRRAEAGHLAAKRGESLSWPGLFVVGAPCASRLTSEFLRGMAKDAPEVAERIASRLGRSGSGNFRTTARPPQ